MSLKSILVAIEQHESMTAALETVLLLARRFDSYVEGFALQSRASDLVVADMVGLVAVEPMEEESRQRAAKARQTFEAFMAERGVGRAGPDARGPSFGWLEDAPEGASTTGDYGRAFDLIALTRPDATTSGLHYRALESSLFESGRPLLLLPPRPPSQIATNVLVAWNGSTEQTRAIAFAMPILEQAERVTVLTIPGGQGVPGPTGEQMTLCLKRNGVAATLLTVPLEGRSTGETILATAAAQRCDLLIKGAYTQSRLRELIFGGATRHVLSHAQLPVVMAH
jgi:nucleotide-binding universal stress UspA family protein